MKKKIIFILLLAFCVSSLFVACSPNDDANKNVDATQQPIISEPENSSSQSADNETTDTKPSDSITDIVQSLLSQEEDGFFFFVNDNKIKLPMKYSEFISKTNASPKDDIPDTILSYDTKTFTVVIENVEATIATRGLEFDNVEIPFDDTYVISVEMPIAQNIELKKGINKNFSKEQILELYGEPDFGNASLEYEFFYYSLPVDSFNEFNFGVELAIGNIDIDDSINSMKNIVSFKYGNLDIGYVE